MSVDLSFAKTMNEYFIKKGSYDDLFVKDFPKVSENTKTWKMTYSKVSPSERVTYFEKISEALCSIERSKILNVEGLIKKVNAMTPTPELVAVENVYKSILFNSKTPGYQWLSNFYHTLIVLDNDEHIYSSSEQAYQTLKAQSATNPKKVSEFFSENNPKKLKKMGDNLNTEFSKKEESNFDRITTMQTIIHKKFELNDQLKALLRKTGSLRIVENTKDTFWGNGNTTETLKLEIDTQGQNLLGNIIMTERENLPPVKIL